MLPSDLSSPSKSRPRRDGRPTSLLAPASPDTNNVTSDTHPPYPASQTASRLQEAPRHPVLKRRDVSSPPSRPPSDSTGVGRADRCRRLGFNTPIPNIPEDLTKLSSGEGIVASSRQAVAISAARREGRQGCLHTYPSSTAHVCAARRGKARQGGAAVKQGAGLEGRGRIGQVCTYVRQEGG